MTFSDSLIFLFVMLLASVLVGGVIFAGAIAVSFMSGARPIVDAPAERGPEGGE